MAFPSSVPSYTGFTSTHTLSQDQHASQHNAEQADIVALAQKVGTGSSTPVNNTVLRGNGTGTTAYGLVRLDTDTAGVLGTANGGTGQTNLTSVPLISPAITGGGSWTGGPTLSGPIISDFTSANHNHQSTSGGGLLGTSAFTVGGLNSDRLNNPYKFSVFLSVNQSVGASSWTKVNLNAKSFDSNSNFDNASNFQFTAPITGFYQFNALLTVGASSTNSCIIGINVGTFSGAPTYQASYSPGNGTTQNISLSVLVSLSSTQTVQLYGYAPAGTFYGGSALSTLQGFLVSAA